MTEPSAKVILDSISPRGHRLTTIEVVMHRFVLSEFNTHRVFSRNSASSRAIPVRKQLERVQDDTAFPISWPREQPGMQGGDDLSQDEWLTAMAIWDDARDGTVIAVERLQKLGLHKSVTNRLLEPFMWHTVIVSSTEWDNFWGLRCNPMAQPEMRAAAEAMKVAYDASTPKLLQPGEWHMPYMQPDESTVPPETARRLSAARCARVSYLTHDGVRDHEKDLELCDRLTSATPPHSSPLEHVATPTIDGLTHLGNFTGWRQFRHEEDR